MSHTAGSQLRKLSDSLAARPVLREVLLWAIPSLLLAIGLRALLLWYSPLAYWGSDSRSFMGFTDGVLNKFYFSLNEKRRYLYPLLMLPFSVLPGGTLRWIAIAQAAMGVLTVLPFAYTIRKSFVSWKFWIVPLSLLFAGLPVFLWYEHELIAESLFFQGFVWVMAGWVAWVSQKDRTRACHVWWWFFVPFAVMVLTKPSTKFLWPGVLLALVLVGAWRILRWKQWVALAALFFVGLTVGDEDQSAWLLYTSSFPLTRMDSALHADYKEEIRTLVAGKEAELAYYEEVDDEIHDFLRSPENYPEYPLWHALAEDEKALRALYRELSFEAIASRPFAFLQIALQRLAGSANMEEFKVDRFEDSYFVRRFREAWDKSRNPEGMIRIAFGIPKGDPMPPWEEFEKRISPRPGSAAAGMVNSWVRAYMKSGDLLQMPEGQRTPLKLLRPTLLGWVLFAGLLISLLPPFRASLGVWSIAAGGYLLGVYLVGIQHSRYFALVWPLVILLLAVPLDGAVRLLGARARNQS